MFKLWTMFLNLWVIRFLATHFAQPDPNATQAAAEYPYPVGAAKRGLPAGAPTLQVITASGALVIPPGPDQTVIINKAGVALLSLADPVAGAFPNGQDGQRLTILSDSAYAHVVTASTVHNVPDGTSTGKDILTFPAYVGALAELVAYNGKWRLARGSTTAVAVATASS